MRAFDGVYSTTIPLYYEGICIGGPLHDTELRSTEAVHRVSVPQGYQPDRSANFYIQTYALKEYRFRNGQWEYQE